MKNENYHNIFWGYFTFNNKTIHYFYNMLKKSLIYELNINFLIFYRNTKLILTNTYVTLTLLIFFLSLSLSFND